MSQPAHVLYHKYLLESNIEHDLIFAPFMPYGASADLYAVLGKGPDDSMERIALFVIHPGHYANSRSYSPQENMTVALRRLAVRERLYDLLSVYTQQDIRPALLLSKDYLVVPRIGFCLTLSFLVNSNGRTLQLAFDLPFNGRIGMTVRRYLKAHPKIDKDTASRIIYVLRRSLSKMKPDKYSAFLVYKNSGCLPDSTRSSSVYLVPGVPLVQQVSTDSSRCMRPGGSLHRRRLR